MKKKVIFTVTAIILGLVLLGTGINSQVAVWHRAQSALVGTYANSQVDTLTYLRDPYLSALAFTPHFKDSVSITLGVIRRVVDGELLPLQAGDTVLTPADTNFTVAGTFGVTGNPSYVGYKTISLTPYCDAFRIIVTYASTKNGTTNAKVSYIFQQQFYSN